jgi:phosphatidylglycerophosphate synthase
LRVSEPLARRNVNPNSITYLTLLFAVLAILSLYAGLVSAIYGVLVFLVGFFDGVDGAVARLSERSSKLGAFTDSIVDKISEVLLLIAIPIAYPNEVIFGIPVSWWTIVCIASWLLTSYLRSRAENLGVKDLDIGFGARSERLFILSVFAIIGLLFLGLALVTLIGFCTAAYRFHHYASEIRTSSDNVSDHHV